MLARSVAQLCYRLARKIEWTSGRARHAGRRAVLDIERRMLDIERREGLTHPWTVGARRFTAADNRAWWNTHDWSARGEEWTPNSAWKEAVVGQFLDPHIPRGGTVLEIGPGGGRWTEILGRRSSWVCLLDVAEGPLHVCRERFGRTSTVSCILGDGRTVPLASGSVDGIWSYDVFVHVNPTDAASYFCEFGRVLRPGAHAVIHHPGQSFGEDRIRQHRSDLTDRMVVEFARSNGLDVVLQTGALVNDGDVLTVLRKPDSAP
jgi:ubiquinone/menaquinone biosynthesis C-methylase UbiE